MFTFFLLKFFTDCFGFSNVCFQVFSSVKRYVLRTVKDLSVHRGAGLRFASSLFGSRVGFKDFKKSSKVDKLELINSLFEGYGPEVSVCPFFYGWIGFSMKVFRSSSTCGYISVISRFHKGKSACVEGAMGYGFNVCPSGLIVYPLSFSDFTNLNNYMFNIYRYLVLRGANFYVSSFISLFYCFFGLFFALNSLYFSNSISVLNSNLSLVVSKLSSYVMVVRSFNGLFIFGSIVSLRLVNIFNSACVVCGMYKVVYRPYFVGLTKYVLTSCGVFSVLGFQYTLKTLKKLVLEDNIEWLVDSKANVMSSGFIPVGSGWYRFFSNN